MKSRIFSNWSIPRILYLVLGALIAIQAVYSEQWFELFISGYFIAMSVFAIGCASGTCAIPESKTVVDVKNSEQ